MNPFREQVEKLVKLSAFLRLKGGNETDTIASLRAGIDASVSGSAAAIVNTLTEITGGKALDARQGKTLKDLLDTANVAITTLQSSVTGKAAQTALDTLSATVTALTTTVGTKANQTALDTLTTSFNTLVSVSTDVDTIVNRYNEIIIFLAGISEGTDLAALLLSKVDSGTYNTNRTTDSATIATKIAAVPVLAIADLLATATPVQTTLYVVENDSNSGGGAGFYFKLINSDLYWVAAQKIS